MTQSDNQTDQSAADSTHSKSEHSTPEQSTPEQSTPDRKGVSALQVLQSTLAAALGVQSRKNRERDFEQGKASHFIFAGIAFTLVFIGLMVVIVRTVLSGI